MTHRAMYSVGILALGMVLSGAPSEVRSEVPAPEAESNAPAPDLQAFTHDPALFPILPWDTLHGRDWPGRNPGDDLKGIAECDFTLAGFVTVEDLPLCEELGLAAIMAPAGGDRPWRDLNDAEIDERVRRMVESSAHSKAVLGYYLMDEPGAPSFPALAKAVAAVKKYAPGKLAYINLFPSYATVGAPDQSQLGTASYTEYLERFVTEVRPQFLSYDNYMVQYSDDLQEPNNAAIYFADLLEVRRVAQKYHLPFWNIVSCNRIRKQTTIPSPANLALQAYTTLAAGGRGVSWYKYFQDGYDYSPMTKAGDRTETWRYLQVVNKQVRTLGPILNQLSSTGVFFTTPSPASSPPELPGRVVKAVQATDSLQGAFQDALPVMVGEFQDEEGVDHVMLVNLSLERSANIKFETVKPYATKEVFSAEDGQPAPLDEQNGHWLVAGQGVLIRLR